MRVVIAYLDPGTGSLVVQAVLGGVAGAVVFFKVMGRRVLRRGRSLEPAPGPGGDVAVASEPKADDGAD
jgi:hypothetical protein